MKTAKAKPTMNGKPKKGAVRKALGFVKSHPKTAAGAAGVLAAGVGAYALLRRGKKGGAKKAAAGRRKTAAK